MNSTNTVNFTNEEANFPIRIEKLVTAESTLPTNRKAIIREDNNAVLGVVSDRYKVIPNTLVQEAFDNVIFNTFGENVKVETHLPSYGSRMFKKYLILDDEYRVPIDENNDDLVRPTMTVFNSYDQSYPIGYTFGGYRLVCKNGLIIGKTIAKFSVKHFDVAKPMIMSEELKENFQIYFEAVDSWKMWKSVDWSMDKAEQYLTALEKVISNAIREEILGEYKDYEKNKWMFFNAITYVLTHKLIATTQTQKMNLENRRIEYGHILTKGLYA